MKISKTVQSIPPSGIRVFFDLVLGMKDVISLGVGEPDFVTPWNVREAAIYGLEEGYTSYTSNKGMAELRQELARYLERKYGLKYDPEEGMLITVGVSEAVDLALRTLIEPGDKVLVPEPSYVSYGPNVTLCGGKPVFIRTGPDNGYRITAADIDRYCDKKTKILFLNYPSNPTGASYSKQDLLKIARAVLRHDLMVITDEIYCELTYDYAHTPFPGLPGMKERTIYLNGFSKAFAMTGWRIGYACGPKEAIYAMTKIHQYTMMCVPIMSQIAAREALKNCEKSVQEMKREYRRRRSFVVSRLNEMGLDCHMPEGAFYAFPSIKRFGLSSLEFSKRLLESQKVAVVPGTAFGPLGEGFIRISYASSMDKLKEAMRRMEKFLSGMDKGR
ncbi:MAG: aminotransferase class I/II-fold pyridoxal phosphate-dependent enzyme [Candidatus Omnitrophica bacterium]|nr:aminotransferase class I/II-fold pyridoxal phosphate-dependent enzyme [Candidatus Omnitrophota bacterium]